MDVSILLHARPSPTCSQAGNVGTALRLPRFEGPLSPIPCIMLDLSEGGARLHAHEPAEIPDKFQLHVESEGLTFSCEVVWRQGNELGVRFVGS